MRSPVFFLAAALLAGCGKGNGTPAPSSSAPAPGASGSAAHVEGADGVPIGSPISVAKVVAAVNPKHQAPYAGPKGTLKGTVRIDGDPPPDTGLKFPAKCKDSAATYGKLFRVGLDKALADVMVAVTGYDGYVPAAGEAVQVPIHRCAPQKRTVALTYGQRVEVSNLDKIDSYVPYLDGAGTPTVMVATPGGAPVKIYPTGPSPVHYMLRDQLGSGFVADAFIVNYATIDVTGLDGQYEIKNIPVGKVRVNALLPVLTKSEGQEIEIKEGDNTLDFTLHFDAAKDLPPARPASSAAAAPPKPPVKPGSRMQ